MITVQTYGTIPTKGSFRNVGRRGGKAVLVNSNKETTAWTNEFRAVLVKNGWGTPGAGAFHVHLYVYKQRPKSHYSGRGENAAIRKECASEKCLVRPDLDKVARAALDAMTGYVYFDDSQVVQLDTEKHWAGRHGVRVEVHGV